MTRLTRVTHDDDEGQASRAGYTTRELPLNTAVKTDWTEIGWTFSQEFLLFVLTNTLAGFHCNQIPQSHENVYLAFHVVSLS